MKLLRFAAFACLLVSLQLFAQTQITTGVTADPPNINGNNVSVDTETISMIDTGLKYQLATQEMNNKFRILHDSMRQDL